MLKKNLIIISNFCIISNLIFSCHTSPVVTQIKKENKIKSNNIILFVWDGLRPDVLNDPKAEYLIKNLKYIAENGVEFKDNHSAYPTFTMNNAQAFATGDYAGKSGFYGNYIYEPWRAQKKFGEATNASGNNITSTFLAPIFTEDYKILQALDRPNVANNQINEPLLHVSTLLEKAHATGLTTSVVGKSGPAFFQDYKSKGYILDEKHVWPLSFAIELQNHNYKLPKLTINAYEKNQIILTPNNGDPTASESPILLDESGEEVSDPSRAKTSPFNKKNEYMADIFLNYILPKKLPELSVVWLRNPDSTQHEYGPGTIPYYNALASNDIILGNILNKLKELKIYDKTNIIIVSDHAHSNILATKRNDANNFPQLMYPLHEIVNGKISNKSNSYKVFDTEKNKKYLVTSGYSVSGTVRTADLITKANLKTSTGLLISAFDGGNCAFNTAMSGIRNEDGTINMNSIGYNSADGSCVDKNNKNSAYTSPAYLVPKNLSNSDGVEKVIIAANGGTDYIYIPNHNPLVIETLSQFFQRRQEYSAIFIDDIRYKNHKSLAGTLPLSYIKLENMNGRNPDMVISLTHNPDVIVNGLAGTEFNSTDGYAQRGDHGSFGKTDVNNILLAIGPDFHMHMKNYLPSGNVDVAPTIAHILNFKLENTDGRILYEAIKNSGMSSDEYKLKSVKITSNPSCQLEIYEPTTHPINFSSDSKNKYIDPEVNSYHTELNTKVLQHKNGNKYFYFDSAEGKRSKSCPDISFTQYNFEN